MKPIKVEYQNQVECRTQIKDMLMYMSKEHRKWNARHLKTVELRRWCESVQVTDILEYIKDNGNDPTLFIETVSEGMPFSDDEYYYYITLNKVVPIDDFEWYESIVGHLCPSQYQINEYRTYQQLKEKYEGTKNA